jgi:hypothetical protein
MSDDSGIYTIKTPKGDGFEFRVADMQGFDNIEWDENAVNPNDGSKGWHSSEPDILIKNARGMFKNAKLFTSEKEALEESLRISEETFNGYTEYGICLLSIDREF